MLPRRLWPVAAFTFLYMAIALGVALARWNTEFLYYGAIMIVLVAVVFVIDRRVKLSSLVLWGLSLWGLAHLLGGTLAVPESWLELGAKNTLYNVRLHPDIPRYDQVVHALGFGISTLLAWECLRYVVRKSGGVLRPTLGVLTLCALVGMGLGALNEVVEFAATRVSAKTNVGGFENTGWDLVSNLVGCIAAAALIRAFYRSPARSPRRRGA